MKTRLIIFVSLILLLTSCSNSYEKIEKNGGAILKYEDFRHHIDYFNRMEDENIIQAVSNSESWEWMTANVPLFECPQDNFEQMFWYRWWTLRKHIKNTELGYVMTEFLVDRSYADKYNLIACAKDHHLMESRWLHRPDYMNEYIHVWYRGNKGQAMEKINAFSNWTADALYRKYLVDGDEAYILDLLPDLIDDFKRMEAIRRHDSGLFWQRDVQDGMEESISGGRHVQNARPTINSYMYANAIAISKMAAMAGNQEVEELYRAKADTIFNLIHSHLWSPELNFFETLKEDGVFAGVREAIGFIPWYFNIPTDHQAVAWNQLKDEEGFLAPYGLTTAERRHPLFRSHGCCSCEWDGAIWPFATSQTLTGLANLLNNYEQDVLSKEDYFHQMELYVESQYHRGRPYIGEYLDELSGYWLKGDQERSRYYNHSTFNDLIITGLIGLRPRADDVLEINPLLPEGSWDWFALDNVMYKGNMITVLWDKYGSRYKRGKGFFVLVNGKQVAASNRLESILVKDVISKQKPKEETVADVIPEDLPWSERMALSMMKRSPELYRSWGYMQGLLLTSFEALWKHTGNRDYLTYIYEYADDMIDADGTIKNYQMETFNIDNINAGRMLFSLYEETGEERFKTAIKTLRSQMEWHPKTTEGGFWHKLKYPWQMWLDGAYMSAPFLACYAAEFNDAELFDELTHQLLLMNKYLHDPETDLLYHGWDESRIMDWADPQTGCSSNFWGRAIAWYLMAIVDILDFLPENHPQRTEIIHILDRSLRAVVKYQDRNTGVWYLILDRGKEKGNYLESSASSMFVYVMAKGLNKGYISEEFRKALERGYEGILTQFIRTDPDGEIHISRGCRVAGLSADRDGSFEYYISEPFQDNDLKAIGPFILASLELNQ